MAINFDYIYYPLRSNDLLVVGVFNYHIFIVHVDADQPTFTISAMSAAVSSKSKKSLHALLLKFL